MQAQSSKNWRKQHEEIERLFLDYLKPNCGLVLKGGTALMMCYGLNRFSEDLDFDALHKVSTVSLVKKFCKQNNFELSVKKNTDTVQRATIHYGSAKPLKIETSYRRLKIDSCEYTTKNNVCVYTIETLAMMKLNAYLNRDKLRDLFDTIFIVNNYWGNLPHPIKLAFQNAFSEKGFDYFELIITQQQDDLIDAEVLTNNFFNALEIMDLQRG